MRMILIIKLPDGEAPVEIRQAWIGLKLSCIGVSQNKTERIGFIVGQQDASCILIVAGIIRFETQAAGVLTGRPLPEGRKFFAVNQSLALQVLKRNNPKAAKWWLEHGFPQSQHAEFLFGCDEAIEIQPRDG